MTDTARGPGEGEDGVRSQGGDDTAKCLAVALLRWSLGVLFLMAGVPKLFMLKGFVAGHLVPAFEKTFLPAWLVALYGYALPFVEAGVGILLLAGFYRKTALLVAGVTLISLAFGQMLIQGQGIVANIMFYILMTAAALFGQEYDRWASVGCCRKDNGEKPDGSAGCGSAASGT